jgi:cobalamin synthase
LQKVLPLPASVFCAIVFAAFITNGFHEDGLADSFDGFGGGWTKDRVLEIMRDSRIGTYGTLALIFHTRQVHLSFVADRKADLALADRRAHSVALDDSSAVRVVALCAR